jgi:hypothetical protein
MATKQTTHNAIAESVQVAEWNMKQKQEDLVKSIRDQVLANATIVPQPIHQHQPFYQNNQHHYQPPPPAIYGNPNAQYENQKSTTKMARPYLTMIASVFVALLALAVKTLFMHSSTGGGDIAFLTTAATKRTPCFIDNDTSESKEETTHEYTSDRLKCDTTIAKKNCPDGALCRNGVLHSCLDQLESVAISGDGCVLSDATNATLARVEEILTKWTVQHTCALQGCQFATVSANAKGPLFSLIDLDADEATLAKSHKLMIIKDEDGIALVGLSDHYMDNELFLPWMCWLSLLFLQLVQAISALTFGLVRISWSIGMAYPLVSIICLVVLWVLRYLRLRKVNHQVLLRDVAHVRQMTYQKLMADSLEHVVLHLRDEIALDLHPTSKSGRTYIISKVWPRVVGDVRLDNRVHKTNQLCLGKPRDVWQWVATPQKR